MEYNKYIERNPDVLSGKPVLKGTRISVEHIMRKVAQGYTPQDIVENLPHLTIEQIQAAFSFAADTIANEDIIELA